MNVGYSGILCDWEEVNKASCPICGADIYVSKYGMDYACTDRNCPLWHGSIKLIEDIESVLKLKKDRKE